jgi:hypothetical protein
MNGQFDTPRAELRQRMSVCNYDNLIVYQYFHQLLEDVTRYIQTIEASLAQIRLVMLKGTY